MRNKIVSFLSLFCLLYSFTLSAQVNELPRSTPEAEPSPVAGALLVAAAAALWGTVGTAQTFIVGGLAPAWVGALRLIFASVFFGLLLLSAGRTRDDRVPAERFPFGLALFAGLAMGFYNLAFFAGVKAAGIAVGTAAVIGSAPVWAGPRRRPR